MDTVMLLVALLVCVNTTNGFLLEQNGQPNSLMTNDSYGQCVSQSEFEATKKSLQRTNDELRHKLEQNQIDFERALQVLTGQIQTRLMHQEQINKALNTSGNTESLNNILKELAVNFTLLQKNFEDLNDQCDILETEVVSLKQANQMMSADMKALKQLDTIRQLETLNSVQQKVLSIESKTNTLTLNEQARRQDFLALRNETLVNSRQIADLSKSVVLCGCRSTGFNYPANAVVIFSSVKTQSGISNSTVTTFINTGKFHCELNGLYFVAIPIVSATPSGRFALYKNGNEYTHSYISEVSNYQSASMAVTIELKTNDTIWVQTIGALNIDYEGSCMTIIKV